jgi:hypothetical protein
MSQQARQRRRRHPKFLKRLSPGFRPRDLPLVSRPVRPSSHHHTTLQELPREVQLPRHFRPVLTTAFWGASATKSSAWPRPLSSWIKEKSLREFKWGIKWRFKRFSFLSDCALVEMFLVDLFPEHCAEAKEEIQ